MAYNGVTNLYTNMSSIEFLATIAYRSFESFQIDVYIMRIACNIRT